MSYLGWEPITDLLDDWGKLADSILPTLSEAWRSRAAQMRGTPVYQTFLNKMHRRIAIETGVLERLYTIDRGITLLLIEQGIDEALIAHHSTDRPVIEVIQLIRDQQRAIEGLYDFVGSQHDLSISFIKRIHQLLTQHQEFVEGKDQFGRLLKIDLIRGDWKKQPNNPTREDGSVYYYCPPEQVASQMDQLMDWHQQHLRQGVPPEIEAAWLHHRFTQIHPFQDGNGRVARILASLVFVKEGWFPLTITGDQRKEYISALENADKGNLQPLVHQFAQSQQRALNDALDLAEDVEIEYRSIQEALGALADKVQRRQLETTQELQTALTARAQALHRESFQRLQELYQHLASVLAAVTQAKCQIRQAELGSEEDSYNRYQIIKTAQKLGYYADLEIYRSWIVLKVTLYQRNFELLFSLHGYGRQKLLRACAACAYERIPTEDSGTEASHIEPLSLLPFVFSHQTEDLDQTIVRFKEWLDNATTVGIAYIQRQL